MYEGEDEEMRLDFFVQKIAPAALFIALEGLYASSVIAGDGIVVLQREVPARSAIREGFPGNATSIDVSPDDKVIQATDQAQSISGNNLVKSTEIGDADFANVSSGTPQPLSGVAHQLSTLGLTNNRLISGHGITGEVNAAGSVQSISPMISSSVGVAVGGISGRTNEIGSIVNNALSGLAGNIGRSAGN
jgi:hypothetical protein